jgi:hypothetical protein
LTMLIGLLQTTLFARPRDHRPPRHRRRRVSVITYTMPFWLLLLAWVFLGGACAACSGSPSRFAFAGLVLVVRPWELVGVVSGVLIAARRSSAASALVVKLMQRRHRGRPLADHLADGLRLRSAGRRRLPHLQRRSRGTVGFGGASPTRSCSPTRRLVPLAACAARAAGRRRRTGDVVDTCRRVAAAWIQLERCRRSSRASAWRSSSPRWRSSPRTGCSPAAASRPRPARARRAPRHRPTAEDARRPSSRGPRGTGGVPLRTGTIPGTPCKSTISMWRAAGGAPPRATTLGSQPCQLLVAGRATSGAWPRSLCATHATAFFIVMVGLWGAFIALAHLSGRRSTTSGAGQATSAAGPIAAWVLFLP